LSASSKKSVNNGDLLSIRSRVAYLGQKSITIHSQVYHGQEEAPLVSSMTTFVKVDKDNKPLPHGFTLPADYIAQNKTIYDEAIRMRQSLRERK
jgi:acyl-CoA hydrolase